MNRFLFRVRTCLLENGRHVRLLLVVVLSMTAGLLVPCIMLGFFRTALLQVATIHTPSARQTFACSLYAPALSEQTLKEMQTAENAVSISIEARLKNVPVSWENSTASTIVSFASPRYFDDFSAPRLVKGRMMTNEELQSSAEVCVVEESFIFNHGDISLVYSENAGKRIQGGRHCAGIFITKSHFCAI